MLSFLSPTKDQMVSYLMTLVKVAGGFLAGRGITVSPDVASIFFGPEAIQFYAGILMALVPLVRDYFIHSDAGKLAAASALAVGPDPKIKPIQALPTAPPEIQAVADNKKIPGVVRAPAPAYTPPEMKR